jgi:hypothetical protein
MLHPWRSKCLISWSAIANQVKYLFILLNIIIIWAQDEFKTNHNETIGIENTHELLSIIFWHR